MVQQLSRIGYASENDEKERHRQTEAFTQEAAAVND